ncbi:hypothetical protein [Streptomyces sp. NBC_01012]|uniref:hypothetical protein n=1 Tax=Streptomyces sp. NBC_01012 TaxID=2903717 RepID=UPI0038675044|nr:hypothetical protein OG623_06835 [Streptomyces sp. NBC_01012]
MAAALPRFGYGEPHRRATRDAVAHDQVTAPDAAHLERRPGRRPPGEDPYDGVAHHACDAGHHADATDTVHTGPNHVGYMQLPIVPRRPVVTAPR